MSTEENKAIARRFFEETERGKGAASDQLFAPNYRHYVPGSPGPLDKQHSIQFSSMFFSAFPDAHFIVEDQIAEGDKVVTRITFRGTHKGDFQGLPPTGKPIAITGIQILQIANGKIVEHRAEFDALGIMQQLGAIPAPGQAPQ